MSLLVDFCSYEAAKHAVMNWHYSQTMPRGKLMKIGVWESDRFVGAVIFGRALAYGTRFGLDPTNVCELVRVALTNHKHATTEIVAHSLRLLKATSPGLRLILSFADSEQGHLGTIYQAGNWTYLGTTSPTIEARFEGRWIHDRDLRATGWGTLPRAAQLSKESQDALPRRTRKGKYRYAYPLDKAMRRQITPLGLPYPTELAVQVSTVKHQPPGLEGRVQSLGTAPQE